MSEKPIAEQSPDLLPGIAERLKFAFFTRQSPSKHARTNGYDTRDIQEQITIFVGSHYCKHNIRTKNSKYLCIICEILHLTDILYMI